MIHKPNFFVFTGGPGAGKTTLLRHLEASGELVVEESARAVIREDPGARGGEAFFRRIAARDIAAFDGRRDEDRRVFFDRGLMDCHGADGIAPWPELEAALASRRYAEIVFVFPPWREIYRTDAERIQDFAHGERVFGFVMRQLPKLGYAPVVVPVGPVEARAAFVLEAVAGLA
ncbi:AAA family ATPase [Phenylobacterium soli]|uniref:ATPase n=1 Tax=Phenylobacterium soli TaxID=2170551 RepID=A0A328ALI0_9CAUL|nr:AAA family ATPase [Phenylobacterium soli]RAK55793.1 ATPase [Phenylobacterium soli]